MTAALSCGNLCGAVVHLVTEKTVYIWVYSLMKMLADGVTISALISNLSYVRGANFIIKKDLTDFKNIVFNTLFFS